uniref:Uncharacterized protein n=1 Tax=Alexandrium catenella TaxID=2925 RepID=A0A7S1WKX6_ALECA|mmetsp:Transcript_69788/g.185467  ORF Transcript_69788/g.185467 Transcript_69788/m.185467 type:complete len:406 (+) Transcript_69788:154-1371(+)
MAFEAWPGDQYGTDAVSTGLQRLHDAGVELDSMAMQALNSLPPEHAAEMLDYVAENHTYLRNPSRYISSTVSRGFVPRRGGGAPLQPGAFSAESPAAALPAPGHAQPSEDLERLFARAQEVGMTLSTDAQQALGGLPLEHASELLEFVLEKHGELRDPSNYIASTVARGFKSRRGGAAPVPPPSNAPSEAVAWGLQRLQETGVEIDDMAKQALATLPPDHALEMLEYVTDNHTYLRNPSNYISSTVARGFVPRKAGGLPAAPSRGGPMAGYPPLGAGASSGMVPQDLTPLERRVLQLNAQGLSEQVDFATYLALRCVPRWQAMELLDSLEAKGAVISSPCNYVQAAVSKIQRGQGWSGGPPGSGGGYYSGHEGNGQAAIMQYPAAAAGAGAASMEQQSYKRQRMW